MFSKRSSLVALCIWLAFAQGCRNEPLLDLTLAHEVSPQPPRVGPVTITLRLTDTAGGQVDGARITLEANMSHAGMVPVFADARETEPGRYQSTVELTMAGDWFILVHVSLTDGRKLDRQFEIKGVALQ